MKEPSLLPTRGLGSPCPCYKNSSWLMMCQPWLKPSSEGPEESKARGLGLD